MGNPNKEHYFFSDQKYICFLTSCQNAIRLRGVPEYSSRYSRKDFTQHQLLTLLLLKKYLGARYRFTDLIEIMNIIPDNCNSSLIIPTFRKFSKSVPATILKPVIPESVFIHDRMEERHIGCCN